MCISHSFMCMSRVFSMHTTWVCTHGTARWPKKPTLLSTEPLQRITVLLERVSDLQHGSSEVLAVLGCVGKPHAVDQGLMVVVGDERL